MGLPCATNAAVLPAALPTQGPCTTLSRRSFPWNKGVKLKSLISFQHGEKADQCVFKCRLRLGRGNQPKVRLKVKPFKISSFKGSAQNGETESRIAESNSCKNSVQLSIPAQAKDEMTSGFSDREEVSLSYTSKNQGQTFVTYLGVQTLLKKWLLMLRTQSLHQNEKAVFDEELQENLLTESHCDSNEQSISSLTKTAWNFFLALDVAIKIPLLIFVPGYLAVNIIYGAEVARELTPMWVFGPLIVAVYLKLIQALCVLYIFSFKQTIGLIKNLPSYYNYLSEGGLRNLWAWLWHPVGYVMNLDYGEFLKQKLRELKEGAYEMYLDFIESIWPYYCRTIRFLKKANLI